MNIKLPAIITLLSSIAYLQADTRVINSVACAEKIPAAKEIMTEGERTQKTRMNELKEIETKAQKIVAEIQKETADLVAKNSTMNSDAKYKAEKAVKDKQSKVEEMQRDYQRIYHDLESEMQMVQMRLQPFIIEVIQNAQEIASKNPMIDMVWDTATKQYIYNKPSLDLSEEVVKLTETKNKDKATTVAKNKPTTTPTTTTTATKAPTSKVA
jgi:Skp family chaperone for outer membrane proteins